MKRIIIFLFFFLSVLVFGGRPRSGISVSAYNSQQKSPISESVVTTFQGTNSNWTKSGNGTISNDTTDFIYGTQSLKLVTNGDGVLLEAVTTAMSPTVDYTGKFFKIWLKVTDVEGLTNVEVVRLYLRSGVGNWSYWDFMNISNNVWTPITVSWSDMQVQFGTLNRAAIDKISLWIRDKNSTSVTVRFNMFATVPEPAKGVVTFNFDDNFTTAYTVAYPILDTAGFPATTYVIPDLVGTTGYTTLAQLKELQADGWQIGSHGAFNYTSYNNSKIITEILRCKTYLLQNGFTGGDDFAYPGGGYNEAMMPIIRSYFKSARIGFAEKNTYPPEDYCKLQEYQPDDKSLNALKLLVDAAVTNKDWLILLLHRITTDDVGADAVGVLPLDYDPDDFQAIVTYIKAYVDAGTLEVKTTKSVLDADTSRMPIGRARGRERYEWPPRQL
jgi:peptidoglycan/xylan/chitin deacetylase (PgdA/CDA1 family)